MSLKQFEGSAYDFAYRFVKQSDGTYLIHNPYTLSGPEYFTNVDVKMGHYVGYDPAKDVVRIYPSGHPNILRWRVVPVKDACTKAIRSCNITTFLVENNQDDLNFLCNTITSFLRTQSAMSC